MADPAPKHATYADLEAVPPHLVAEILRGSLVTHPRPTPRHALAASNLGATVINFFHYGKGGPGGWVFLVEPELHLGENVVVPDIAGWRTGRFPHDVKTAWIDVAPDWVCEVLSPSTDTYDRGVKREIYAAAGVGHLWLVNPASRQLEAFQLTAGKWLLQAFLADAAEVSLPPFDAVSFSLGALWPFDPPVDPDAAPHI